MQGLGAIGERLSTIALKKRRGWKPEHLLMMIAVCISLAWMTSGFQEILRARRPYDKASLSPLGITVNPIGSVDAVEGISNASSLSVWDLRPSDRRGGPSVDSGSGESSSFDQKEFKGIPAIYSTTNETYRWEFFGVVTLNRTNWAVFFNPAHKTDESAGWYRFAVGDRMDQDLLVTDIKEVSVTVSLTKEQRDFTLERFRVNLPK